MDYESSESYSLSPATMNKRVVNRSVEWMRRAGQQPGGGWGPRQSLRAWNPWTNETKKPSAKSPTNQQQLSADISAAVGMTTKAAGSVYEFMMNQEMEQQRQMQQLHEYQISDVCSSSVNAIPVKPPRSNSNTNNKNPFSLPSKNNAGLRDIQRHRADGKQTTIITQFKAAEANQDGKVDINIIMDSESNMSNAPEESSDEDATSDTASKDAGADAGAGGEGGGGGGAGASDNEDSGANGSTSDEEGQTPSTSAGGEGEGAAGGAGPEEAGGEEADAEAEAEDSEPAEDLPAPGDDKKENKTDKKKLSMGHLDKEGIVIGCMNVFADVSRKEYIILLTDSVVEAFLVDPGQFRSIAKRTGCEIEVTRRILNRRIGMYRWVKYLVVTLRGPNLVAIDQCDRLMVKMFPPYKIRKPYPEAAQVALFVKESYPDNSDLYFNFQRTGPTSAKVGDLRLQSPFGKNAVRPIESTPWKQINPRLLSGILEPRNLPMAISVEHVYPEWGSEKCGFMDPSCKWEQAGDMALEIEKRCNLERSTRVKQRKLGAEPLFAGGD